MTRSGDTHAPGIDVFDGGDLVKCESGIRVHAVDVTLTDEALVHRALHCELALGKHDDGDRRDQVANVNGDNVTPMNFFWGPTVFLKL